MNTSQFNPEAFLEATTTEAATKRQPLPTENPASEDHLYIGMIGTPKIREWQGKKDPTQTGIALDLPIKIDVPAQLQESLKLPAQITLTDGFIINMNAQGAIDWAPGANRRARVYREACGLNVAGQAFAFRMFEGKMVKIQISHNMYEGDVVDGIKTVLKA